MSACPGIRRDGDMSLPLFFLSIDVAAVVCLTLVGVQALRRRPHLLTAQIIALIVFDSICNVALTHHEYGPWMPEAFRTDLSPGWIVLFNLARNFTPALFMALCYALFTDRRGFPRWLIALVAVQMFLEEPVRLLIPAGWPYANVVTQTAPALLQAFFVGMALFWTVADWRDDLIQSRRRLRAVTAIVIGLDMLVSGVGMRVLVDPDSPLNYHLHIALVASDLAIALLVLFQLSGRDVDVFLDPARIVPPPGPAVTPARISEDAIALARLATLMEGERIYRLPSISLKALADRVGLPEYRLRKLIHEELGFANFNAFLHAWRVREACVQLRDPALRRTPILTIALSVGYQSVNTFNRGFRDVMDMTPSVYRALEDAPLPQAAEILSPKTA